MGDMEKLQKKRAVARGWATRKSNVLKGLLNNPDVSVIDLQAAMDDFDQRLASLEEVQTMLELETDFVNLDEELDSASEFFQEVRKPRLQAAQRWGDMMKGEQRDSSSSSSPSKISSSSKIANVKLPKLELPKFNGDVTLWQSFWDHFKMNEKADIPVITKFSYLQSLLEGRAKGVVKGFAHTEANYQIACDLLKKDLEDLNALGVTEEQCEVFLTPLILSCLPEELRLEWAREGSGRESDISWLLQFLQKEIERSETFKAVLGKAEGRFVESEKRRVPSASALYTSSEVGSSYCAFCSKKHKSEKCWDIQKLSEAFIKGTAKGEINTDKAMESDMSVKKVTRVKVYGDSGICCEATLFDTGSDRSYVSSNLVKKVKPKWVSSETVSYAAFGGSKFPPGKQSNIFDLKLVGLQGVKHLMALEIPKVCAPLTRPCIPSKLVDAFSDFQLADDYKNYSHLSIDILVGLDAYWGFMDPEIKPYHSNGLVAQKSVFGWVLSGSWMNSSDKPFESTQMLCIGNVTDSDLSEFWSLESVGINQKETVSNPFTSDPVLQQFCGNVKFDGERYEVGLPWKSDECKKNLRNNEGLARKRLEGLERKLDKDPQLKKQYSEVFTGYEEEGIIEEVPSNEVLSSQPTYYMPHRPVVKESSASTKIRSVFDASAASYNDISLNDCLESGPSLNPDLVKVLIRFRWKVALTADITKVFLQICVQEKDRDVHRFLWKCKDSIRIMRFVRVPFGNTSSPFLLNATINTEVIEELKENLYVDDWLSGADSAEEASVKFKEAQRILALDQFVFEEFDFDSETQLVSTKRAVLSLIAKLFDPLEISWRELSGLELHAFGDASEKGYGASVYLRVPLVDGTYLVSFVVARSRVAPIKRVTLPRIELLGALLCARLLDFVKSALYLDKTVTYCCWTDSKVALAWIKGNPCRWKAFVSNRVVEIQSLTSPCHWYHCSGKENPADLISRGELAEPLVNSTLWMNGPSWLSKPLTFSDRGEAVELPVEESYSEKNISCVSVTPPKIFEFERWSQFNKAHHVVALVMRFINNTRPHSVKVSGPLSSDELVKAKTKLFYCVQRKKFAHEIADLRKGKSPARSSSLCRLDPFVDDEGLLKIKGRLENADLSFESKHPVIVPSGHVAKLLVQFQHIFLKHAGVSTIVSTLRGSYWIVGVRRIAKTVCRVCVRCKRFDSRACNQPAAPLPGVKIAPPFTVTDNARTFLGAARQLQQEYGPLSPQWKFIVSRSPWWGGWWERLIRSVKSALRKTIGIRSLSRIELETTLQEVEACVNSRPLTFVGDEPDVSNPVTPSHFLIGRNAGLQISDQPSYVTGKDLIIRESVRQQQLDIELWSNDYLRNLPPALLKYSLVMISVRVKTDKGTVSRPVQKLHDLEMYNPL
ncbi:uncharacterized protein LOC134782212 [Penaeus indicus]|uniref:uncharacterized protein LOC134782212 n=1 Tax=Penaeus indicus TaxID=29960 RepID=UPI00300D118A